MRRLEDGLSATRTDPSHVGSVLLSGGLVEQQGLLRLPVRSAWVGHWMMTLSPLLCGRCALPTTCLPHQIFPFFPVWPTSTACTLSQSLIWLARDCMALISFMDRVVASSSSCWVSSSFNCCTRSLLAFPLAAKPVMVRCMRVTSFLSPVPCLSHRFVDGLHHFRDPLVLCRA